MPRRAKKGTRGQQDPNDICNVCCDEISADRADALFCSGECQRWLHRYCASVSVEQHKSIIANSASPFLCPTCARSAHQREIEELSSAVSALKAELSQLKEAYSAISADLSNYRPTQPPARTTYAAKAATNNRKPAGKHPGTSSHNRREKRQAQPNSGNANTNTSGSGNRTHAKSERVVVQGVRRIWGTLKSASTTAVASTLSKLTTLGTQLTVKKKVNPRGNHWWFLVRGTEEHLKKLEDEWERVSLQINWKLEPCTRPKDNSDAPNMLLAADTIHPDTQPNENTGATLADTAAPGESTNPATSMASNGNVNDTTETDKAPNQPITDNNQSFLEQEQLPRQLT